MKCLPVVLRVPSSSGDCLFGADMDTCCSMGKGKILNLPTANIYSHHLFMLDLIHSQGMVVK